MSLVPGMARGKSRVHATSMAGDYFIADDLSGALDAAAAFHAAGRRVRVRLDPEPIEPDGPEEVIGYTTETRNRPDDEAARVVRELIRQQSARGARLLYKKIDSTLRGPVGPEIRALREALPGVRVLFAPANPVVGRTVRRGILQVNGVPVAETEFGRDPLNPVLHSCLADVLGMPTGESIEVPDIEIDEDLKQAVLAQEKSGGLWVAIGSGALARPVARLRSIRPKAFPVAAVGGPPQQLFVCGSSHPISSSQSILLENFKEVNRLNLDPSKPLTQALPPVLAQVIVLKLTPERTDPSKALSAIVAKAADVIGSQGIRRVFVTGGETAFALARVLGETEFLYQAELEPGLSLSRSQGPEPRLWAVKPGSFGDDATWLRAFRALAG